jgi:hypothetical protein
MTLFTEEFEYRAVAMGTSGYWKSAGAEYWNDFGQKAFGFAAEGCLVA